LPLHRVAVLPSVMLPAAPLDVPETETAPPSARFALASTSSSCTA